MDEQFVHVAHFHVKKRRLHMGLSGGPYVWMEKRRSSWWHFPPKNLPGSLIRTSPQRSKQCLRACRAKSRQSWSTRCGTFLSFDGKIDVAHHDQVSVMIGSFWKISSMALSQVGVISKHPRMWLGFPDYINTDNIGGIASKRDLYYSLVGCSSHSACKFLSVIGSWKSTAAASPKATLKPFL